MTDAANRVESGLEVLERIFVGDPLLLQTRVGEPGQILLPDGCKDGLFAVRHCFEADAG